MKAVFSQTLRFGVYRHMTYIIKHESNILFKSVFDRIPKVNRVRLLSFEKPLRRISQRSESCLLQIMNIPILSTISLTKAVRPKTIFDASNFVCIN